MGVKLGDEVVDRVTGFKGTVTGRVQYLTGCNQALVVPRVDDRGAYVDPQWFDEQRLMSTGSYIRIDNGTNPGWDKPAPKR